MEKWLAWFQPKVLIIIQQHILTHVFNPHKKQGVKTTISFFTWGYVLVYFLAKSSLYDKLSWLASAKYLSYRHELDVNFLI